MNRYKLGQLLDLDPHLTDIIHGYATGPNPKFIETYPGSGHMTPWYSKIVVNMENQPYHIQRRILHNRRYYYPGHFESIDKVIHDDIIEKKFMYDLKCKRKVNDDLIELRERIVQDIYRLSLQLK